MAIVERAIVLSNLQLGSSPLDAKILAALTNLGGPKVEVVLNGGTLDLRGKGLDEIPSDAKAAQTGLSAIGQAIKGAHLTVLSGPGDEALGHDEERRKFEKWLGLPQEQVSYGEELTPGLFGCKLTAEDGVAWVISPQQMEPLAGLNKEELLSWGPLRGFTKAFAWQFKNRTAATTPEGPHHHFAHSLGRAVVELARGKEEQLLNEFTRYLDARGKDPASSAEEPVQALLQRSAAVLEEMRIEHWRKRIDTSAAAVILAGAPAHSSDEEAPLVVITGSSAGPQPSWVEIQLAGPLKIKLTDGTPQPTQLPEPAQPAQPAQIAQKAENQQAEKPSQAEPAPAETAAQPDKKPEPSEKQPEKSVAVEKSADKQTEAANKDGDSSKSNRSRNKKGGSTSTSEHAIISAVGDEGRPEGRDTPATDKPPADK